MQKHQPETTQEYNVVMYLGAYDGRQGLAVFQGQPAAPSGFEATRWETTGACDGRQKLAISQEDRPALSYTVGRQEEIIIRDWDWRFFRDLQATRRASDFPKHKKRDKAIPADRGWQFVPNRFPFYKKGDFLDFHARGLRLMHRDRVQLGCRKVRGKKTETQRGENGRPRLADSGTPGSTIRFQVLAMSRNPGTPTRFPSYKNRHGTGTGALPAPLAPPSDPKLQKSGKIMMADKSWRFYPGPVTKLREKNHKAVRMGDQNLHLMETRAAASGTEATRRDTTGTQQGITMGNKI